MKRYLAYLKYVLRHKWFVLIAGVELGVPLWRLILHDWDKFLPDEFLPYARAFYAPDGSRWYKPTTAFDWAWMKHQHRNKHHWQYWLDVNGQHLPDTSILVMDSGEVFQCVKTDYRMIEQNLTGRLHFRTHPIPEDHLLEMLADWRGAGQALGKPNTGEWYFDAVRQQIFARYLHPSVRQWLDDRIDPEWSKIAGIVEKTHHV